MAAEPVGTAYVIIRAITSQLSKDIKDGLDKGSKDADTDAAGREIGRSVGESAGDEFGDTWNESSSDSIRDSADSRETRKAQKDYSDRFFTRFSDHFGAGGEDMSERFRTAFSDSADDGDLFGGIDIDRAAGTLEWSARDRGIEALTDRALTLLTSPTFRRAFELGREPEAVRNRYGRTTYGQGCLLARRLVEAGVKFVNVYFAATIGGWFSVCVRRQRAAYARFRFWQNSNRGGDLPDL